MVDARQIFAGEIFLSFEFSRIKLFPRTVLRRLCFSFLRSKYLLSSPLAHSADSMNDGVKKTFTLPNTYMLHNLLPKPSTLCPHLRVRPSSKFNVGVTMFSPIQSDQLKVQCGLFKVQFKPQCAHRIKKR